MALKEEKVFVISGKKKAGVRKETSAVSDTSVMIVKNRHHTRGDPEEPLHRGGAQAGLGLTLPAGSPIVVSRVGPAQGQRTKITFRGVLRHERRVNTVPHVLFTVRSRDEGPLGGRTQPPSPWSRGWWSP